MNCKKRREFKKKRAYACVHIIKSNHLYKKTRDFENPVFFDHLRDIFATLVFPELIDIMLPSSITSILEVFKFRTLI